MDTVKSNKGGLIGIRPCFVHTDTPKVTDEGQISASPGRAHDRVLRQGRNGMIGGNDRPSARSPVWRGERLRRGGMRGGGVSRDRVLRDAGRPSPGRRILPAPHFPPYAGRRGRPLRIFLRDGAGDLPGNHRRERGGTEIRRGHPFGSGDPRRARIVRAGRCGAFHPRSRHREETGAADRPGVAGPAEESGGRADPRRGG
jgi:hypothetical protein